MVFARGWTSPSRPARFPRSSPVSGLGGADRGWSGYTLASESSVSQGIGSDAPGGEEAFAFGRSQAFSSSYLMECVEAEAKPALLERIARVDGVAPGYRGHEEPRSARDLRKHVGREVERPHHVVLSCVSELVSENETTLEPSYEFRRTQDSVADGDRSDGAQRTDPNLVDISHGCGARDPPSTGTAHEKPERMTERVRGQRPQAAQHAHQPPLGTGFGPCEGRIHVRTIGSGRGDRCW